MRTTDYGERRRIWPWLLLLLLLLLALLAGWLWYETSNDDGSSAPTRVADDPGTGTGGPGGVGNVPIAVGGDGSVLSIPDMPGVRLKGDTTFMDLGDIACRKQRYVLMTDGQAHTIDNLDGKTVEALAKSDVPINTVALNGDSDTIALEAIAARTGGTFTKME